MKITTICWEPYTPHASPNLLNFGPFILYAKHCARHFRRHFHHAHIVPKKNPEILGHPWLGRKESKSSGLRKLVSLSRPMGRARFLWEVTCAKAPHPLGPVGPASLLLTKAPCLSFSTSTPGDKARTWVCRVRLTAAVAAWWFHWRTIPQLRSPGCKKSYQETAQQWNHQRGARYNGTLVEYILWSHGSRNTEP